MRSLIILPCLLFSVFLFAQNEHYNFSRLDIYNGLSHNQVNSILRDSDGFLWFGTTSGLDRYDGYSFRVFRNQPGDSTSLKNNSIRSLYELPDGKIWVVTGSVPCIYNSQTEKFNAVSQNYFSSLGLPFGAIINVVKGNNGRYWFLYDSLGLYLYSSAAKKSNLFRRNFKLSPSEKISSLTETKDGKLWLVYQNGSLEEYDVQTNKIIFSSSVLQKLTKENNNYGVIADNDGDLWLWYFARGVFLYHP